MSENVPQQQTSQLDAAPAGPTGAGADGSTDAGAAPAGDQRGQLIPLSAAPWPRYWAKSLDLALLTPLTGFALFFLAPSAYAKLPDTWGSLFLVPIAVLVESILYALFGATPGKWLLGLRVLSINGSRIPFLAIVRRNFHTYWSGLGLFIPVVTMFTLLNAHGKAKRGEPQSWDAATASRCYATRPSVARTWLGAALTILLIVSVRALAAYTQTPEGLLATAVLAINASAPQQVDAVTRLDGAQVGNDHRLQYLYTLTTHDPATRPADLARRRVSMFRMVHHGFCTTDEMKPFREIATTVQYTYRDRTGAVVMDLVVAPKDCATDGTLLAQAAEVNAIAPKQIDEATRLDGAAASGRTFQYLYTLTTYDPSQANAAEFAVARDAFTKDLRNRVCTSETLAWLREAGATVEFIYRDSAGSVVLDVAIPPERCR